MLDLETFLTTVYVLVDEFCQTLPAARHPGPAPALSRSEVVTVGLLSQWTRFRSERAFYRFAEQCLRPYFPALPQRSQFNRARRQQRATLVAVAIALADRLVPPDPQRYELLDGTAVPTRNAKRRGLGWLPGLAAIGQSRRRGWYEGFHLLVRCTPEGVITGFGFGPATVNERALAETCFAERQRAPSRLPSLGTPRSGAYFADSGFAGAEWLTQWAQAYQARVCAPSQRGSTRRWPYQWRRQLASWRQIIETVIDRLHATFRLEQERPHTLSGFQARLAAKVAAHNLCCWLNQRLGRPWLAVADLLAWV